MKQHEGLLFNRNPKQLQVSLLEDDSGIDLARERLPAIGAIAPWFGSARLLGSAVGQLLDGANWIGIPFAGSMAEIPYIRARTIVVNDLHKGVITLARVVSDETLGPKLYRRLRRHALHPDDLAESQGICRKMEELANCRDVLDEETVLRWAEHMFVAAWLARSGSAGTKSEFDAKLALRWAAGGGDSAVRFQNAIRSINAWRRSLRRATFSSIDAFAFLEKCKDLPQHAIYCDQPFPGGPGDKYKYHFTLQQTKRLSVELLRFSQARVVSRFYDHPIVRDLYPASEWTWHHLTGRKQTNEVAPEVLLVRN
jgi:DNA adenine methylase